jgi:hypothetical protein
VRRVTMPERTWKLLIWSPPDPQPTDRLFTLPFSDA